MIPISSNKKGLQILLTLGRKAPNKIVSVLMYTLSGGLHLHSFNFMTILSLSPYLQLSTSAYSLLPIYLKTCIQCSNSLHSTFKE